MPAEFELFGQGSGPDFEREPQPKTGEGAPLERPLRITEAYIAGYWLEEDRRLTTIQTIVFKEIKSLDITHSFKEIGEANQRLREAIEDDDQFLTDYSEGVRARMTQAVRDADAKYAAEHPMSTLTLPLDGKPFTFNFKPRYPDQYVDNSFELTRDNLPDFLRGMRREAPGILRQNDIDGKHNKYEKIELNKYLNKNDFDPFSTYPSVSPSVSLPAWQMGFAASVFRDGNGYLLNWLELPADNEGFVAFVDGMNQRPEPPTFRGDDLKTIYKSNSTIDFNIDKSDLKGIFDPVIRSAGRQFGQILLDRQSPPTV